MTTPNNQQPPAAVLDGVGKNFRTIRVLDRISLTIAPGEFVAVMGASGSGKTTLLNIMGGLLAPDEGAVWIEGVRLGEQSDTQLTVLRRERIGFVFQMYNLVDSLSVAQNILLPKLAANKPFTASDRSAFDILVRRVGLQDRLDHKPAQLSGGEQQRVAVARALINRPALVLADEPTGNLDSENTALLGELFRSLHREHGAAFVLVTHDPSVAVWADRLLILCDGRVLEDVPTSQFSTPEELAVFYQRTVSPQASE